MLIVRRRSHTVKGLEKLINTGEKIDVEFKKSENDLNKDIYTSVCSFNNKNGGQIILGVIDSTKEIRVSIQIGLIK